MKMFKALILLTALQCSAASAALQSIHWQTEGDNLVTLDTTTGIEWLDLTVTRGKSIDEISALLQSSYTGWRLPTITEMRGLMFSIYGQLITADLEYVNSRFASSEMLSRHFMMGRTELQSTTGYYVNNGGVYALLGSAQVQGGNGYFYFNHYRSPSTNYKTVNGGVYLVNDGGVSWSSVNDPTLNINNPNAPINQQQPVTPVNAPSLFACAFIFLFSRLKKQQRATI